jgi:flagellin-like protein
MRKIRAISPLIATIILIAITITAGLLIYNLFFSASSTASNVGQVEIMNAQLVVDSSGNYVLALTIKNTGTKPVNQLQIYYQSFTTPMTTITSFTPPSTTLTLTTLQPGQSYYWRTTTGLPQPLIVGNRYLITVVAVFSDNSSYQVSTTVTATSA